MKPVRCKPTIHYVVRLIMKEFVTKPPSKESTIKWETRMRISTSTKALYSQRRRKEWRNLIQEYSSQCSTSRRSRCSKFRMDSGILDVKGKVRNTSLHILFASNSWNSVNVLHTSCNILLLKNISWCPRLSLTRVHPWCCERRASLMS